MTLGPQGPQGARPGTREVGGALPPPAPPLASALSLLALGPEAPNMICYFATKGWAKYGGLGGRSYF